jgi:hypothetical protein
MAADFAQTAVEGGHMSTLVPALAGEMHAEFPGSLGKICKALCGYLDGPRFVIHVPVKPFAH